MEQLRKDVEQQTVAVRQDDTHQHQTFVGYNLTSSLQQMTPDLLRRPLAREALRSQAKVGRELAIKLYHL